MMKQILNMRMMVRTGMGGMLLILLAACGKNNQETQAAKTDTLALTYVVKTQWAHDPDAFIQGLEIHDGKLYESTGQKGHSWIGIVDVNTGKPDKKVTLEEKYFGEGITIVNNKIYQLTWQNKVGFIYHLHTFKKLGEFSYDTEGWGLTHDNANIIMSDGSEKLMFLDTVTLKPVRTVRVTDQFGPVQQLNELEYIDGYVFANQWETNRILKIDPKSGRVVGRLDLTALVQDARSRYPRAEVLNGIAYHPTTKLLLVTGKNWPMLYVLQVKKPSPGL